MKNVIKRMMLSCNKATILIEKKIDAGLTLKERFQLGFHTSMCSACTNYQKQSGLMHLLLIKHLSNGEYDNSVSHPLPREFKNELLKTLENRKK